MESRSVIFKDYLARLQSDMSKLSDDENKRGIQIVHQISSELLPHISEDGISLNETIVVEIRSDFSPGNFFSGIPLQ